MNNEALKYSVFPAGTLHTAIEEQGIHLANKLNKDIENNFQDITFADWEENDRAVGYLEFLTDVFFPSNKDEAGMTCYNAMQLAFSVIHHVAPSVTLNVVLDTIPAYSDKITLSREFANNQVYRYMYDRPAMRQLLANYEAFLCIPPEEQQELAYRATAFTLMLADKCIQDEIIDAEVEQFAGRVETFTWKDPANTTNQGYSQS